MVFVEVAFHLLERVRSGSRVVISHASGEVGLDAGHVYALCATGQFGAGLGQEFAVEWAPGVDAEGDGLEVFWDVSDYDQRAIEAAASLDVANLDATSLRAILAEHGAPSFFPELDANDEERVKTDGKIPVKNAWLTGVREGRLAWDTMLTLAGLASFSVDQAALDARIRAQLS